ncbi:hypothetical protein MTR_3g013780 [Medicago truncatula]|uniref:F-box domain-containing protein n=1 Tax=Medicago truncatula TaxID=3880 RepID=G7IYN3_MEDTR|nr:hypothetical protein MTR_3g013780 [Medicago truncatula]
MTEENTSINNQLSVVPPSPSFSSDLLHESPLPTLPFDVILEILCRLPVKLQCVCKSWNLYYFLARDFCSALKFYL